MHCPSHFLIESFRENIVKSISFEKGDLLSDNREKPEKQPNGVKVTFVPDSSLFGNFHFLNEYVEAMVKNYVYLNSGLTINFNGVNLLFQITVCLIF